MLAGMCIVTAWMLWNFERMTAPRPCISFKCALAGIWRCWTMTVTMPSWPTWSLRSAENLVVAAAALPEDELGEAALPLPQTTELGFRVTAAAVPEVAAVPTAALPEELFAA